MQTTQLSLSLIPKFKASGPQSMSRSHQDAHAHTLPATIFTAQQEPGLLKPGPTPLSTCLWCSQGRFVFCFVYANDLYHAFSYNCIFSDIWYILDYSVISFSFCLHKSLSCSFELSRTAGMTWHWDMWSYCFSKSGREERIFSWKLSIRFANKEISNMRIFSIMLQVSFFLFKHKKFWFFWMNGTKTNEPF